MVPPRPEAPLDLPVPIGSPVLTEAETAAAGATWSPEGAGWVLRLEGPWTGAAGRVVPEPPAPARSPDHAHPVRPWVIDGSGLQGWDSAGAAVLWQALASWRQQGQAWHWRSMPAGLQAALDLALPPSPEQPPARPGPAVSPARRAGPATTAPPGSQAGRRALRESLRTLAFLGEVLMALAAWIRHPRDPRRLRPSDLVHQLDQAGPLSIPIVSLTCALVGLMLAYMGGAQLDRMGAQGFIADVVTVGMVREMAGLMTGIILAGRLGAAYAAQLASMQAGEEVDALRAMGVDPVSHLVLPRLLALVAMAPLLMAYAAVVGVLAGLPAATWVYGVSAGEYLTRSVQALTVTHVSIGLFKGTLYAALVVLAGCREGLYAERNAQAVGEATTRAVVKALVWIVAAACATTVMFQSLGF